MAHLISISSPSPDPPHPPLHPGSHSQSPCPAFYNLPSPAPSTSLFLLPVLVYYCCHPTPMVWILYPLPFIQAILTPCCLGASMENTEVTREIKSVISVLTKKPFLSKTFDLKSSTSSSRHIPHFKPISSSTDLMRLYTCSKLGMCSPWWIQKTRIQEYVEPLMASNNFFIVLWGINYLTLGARQWLVLMVQYDTIFSLV